MRRTGFKPSSAWLKARGIVTEAKPNKFHAVRTPCGQSALHASHPSGTESRRCDFLYMLKRAGAELYGGKIVEIINQPPLVLGKTPRYRHGYRPDFGVVVRFKDGTMQTVYEEVKGCDRPDALLRRDWYSDDHDDNPIRLVKEIGNSGMRWSTST